MKHVSIAMLNASLRRIDMQIKQALEVNDNHKLETLRKQRGDVANECARILFQPCISKALKAVERAK